jgi:hypothetical protein
LVSRLNQQLPRAAGEPGPDSRRIGLVRADLARASFFSRKTLSTIFPDLQTLINHRIFSVNANLVIQVAVSSLSWYLSDGIGLMSIGAL